jgi:hypothetical protein
MKFSKKDFQKKYKSKEVEELYDPKSGKIGGDTVITQNQVRADTPVIPGDDTTDREEDIPTDTEKYAATVKNTSADMAMSRFNMGTAYGYVREDEEIKETDKETDKERVKRIVKELLNNRSNDFDIIDNKNTSEDVINNKDGHESDGVMINTKVGELVGILKNSDNSEIVQKVIDAINKGVTNNDQ